MSTIKVNTIQNQAGVEVYTAKAWVNFNGTGTVAIRASGNVTSITDNGTGQYTVNFTTAMPDANYAMSTSSSFTFGSPTNNAISSGGSVNASSCKVVNQDAGASYYDVAEVTVAIFR